MVAFVGVGVFGAFVFGLFSAGGGVDSLSLGLMSSSTPSIASSRRLFVLMLADESEVGVVGAADQTIIQHTVARMGGGHDLLAQAAPQRERERERAVKRDMDGRYVKKLGEPIK